MASRKVAPSLFTSANVQWAGQPVVFHNKHGENIELSQNNTVATRVKDHDCGVVCTCEPVSTGQMFKVTVLEKHKGYSYGLVIGLTAEDPETSELPQISYLSLYKNDQHLLYFDSKAVKYSGKEHCKLDFSTRKLNVGQSLGILLTREKDLHWFVDNKWRGMVHVDDYPLDRPLWGLAEVWGKCRQVKAEICSVSGYDKSFEGPSTENATPNETRLIPLKQTEPPGSPDQKPQISENILLQLLQEQDLLRQQLQRKDALVQGLQGDLAQERAAVTSLRTDIQQLQQVTQSTGENQELQQQVKQSTKKNHELQQQVTQSARENNQLQQQVTQSTRENHQLQQQVTQSTRENHQLQQQVTQSTRENHQLQQQVTQSDGEIHQLQQQVVGLRRMLSSLSTTARSTPKSHEIEFWQVSPEEVSIREDQVLGRGAWGYVAKGTFRGTAVAVKRVYPEILEQTTLNRIRREIRTMAHIRHPNLVLFIAAVLNEQTGPMIVTEILDISLRQAYQANRVGANKRRIFQDVSSALVYLHQQREPIIHRDVNSANVLLISSPNDTWIAKLSDFGSANLARYATTPGEGAILYTAPEAYPHPPTSPTPPPPQTTKIDVYSFGVLACEVITRVFPESDKFAGLMKAVGRNWPQIHQLISSCVSHSPQDRPTMVTVLTRLQQLKSEP